MALGADAWDVGQPGHGVGGNLASISRLLETFLALSLLTSVACHPGPVMGTGPKPPAVGGTDCRDRLNSRERSVLGRRVTAIDTQTGTRFDAKTGINGGYTIKVPVGTYRLEVELQPGETVAKQPGETRVNTSDLDPQRHFVIALGKAG